MNATSSQKKDNLLMIGFILAVAFGPLIMTPIGGGYPDLLQKFAIFGVFASGLETAIQDPVERVVVEIVLGVGHCMAP